MSTDSSNSTRAMHVRLCALGGGFLLAGLVVTVLLLSATARLDDTAGWPSVTGRIIGSDEAWGVVRIGRVPRPQRMADVRYAYFVNGQRYQCDALRVLPMLQFSDGTPEEIVARYPVGMAVAVYYDPHNPADALLIPEPQGDLRGFIRSFTFISMFLAFLGVVMVASGALHIRAGDRAARTAAIEARRAPSPPAQASLPAPAAAPPAAGSSAPAAGSPPAAAGSRRPAHWVFRLAVTLLGLFLLMMGGLLAVTAAKTSNPAHSLAVKITCLTLFACTALGGGYLVTRGTRRPSAR